MDYECWWLLYPLNFKLAQSNKPLQAPTWWHAVKCAHFLITVILCLHLKGDTDNKWCKFTIYCRVSYSWSPRGYLFICQKWMKGPCVVPETSGWLLGGLWWQIKKYPFRLHERWCLLYNINFAYVGTIQRAITSTNLADPFWNASLCSSGWIAKGIQTTNDVSSPFIAVFPTLLGKQSKKLSICWMWHSFTSCYNICQEVKRWLINEDTDFFDP